MSLKVKNYKTLLGIVLVIGIIFIFSYFRFYNKTRLPYNENLGEEYESIARDSLMRLCYRLRSSLGTLAPDQEVTVIGIDDKTNENYGKFGGHLWELRIPYDALLKNLQQYFQPSCVAFDIIFKDGVGKLQKDLGIEKISESPEQVTELGQKLKIHGETGEDFGQLNLLRLATWISEQGEILIGNVLATTQESFNTNLRDLVVILAYNLKEDERYYQLKRDSEDPANFEWNAKEVVGEDKENLNEDFGSKIPYVKSMAIPLTNIKNVPDDYVYLPYANLVADSFISYVKLGFINNPRDLDGVVRRTPLVLATRYYNPVEKSLKTVFVPSMSMLACLTHWGVTANEMSVDFNGSITVKTKSGEKKIPIDRYGRMLINYQVKPADVNYVSFAKINEFGAGLSKGGTDSFKGEFRESLEVMMNRLKGRICLVGLTFTANPDVGPTVLDTNTSLVNVHAATIGNIMNENFLEPATDGEMLLIFGMILLVLGACSVLMTPTGFSLMFLLTQGMVFGLSFIGIYYSLFYLPTLYLMVYIFTFYFVVLLVRYFSEEKEKLKIRNMFSTMVSSSVLNYMEKNPESFSLTGSKMSATMMFSDVAGFTSISEGLSPEKLVRLLNKYLTPMTDIIQKLDGYVDKYEGDAIMAEWGVPFPNEKHATMACFACLEQQKKLAEIREDLFKEFGYRLEVRMGVNSGEVSAGNMGSVNRFSYTVMGDAVNLAARLEPTNKVYGTYVMIGETTYDLAKDDIEARLIDKVVVVGKKQAIRVYELLAKKGECSEQKMQVKDFYEKGLKLHEQRQWDEALAAFNKVLEIDPADVASKVLISRIEEYKINPPGQDWQGEYVRKSKD